MFKIEVMLADDHTLVRQGIRSILEMEEDIKVVGEASSGRELLAAIKGGIQPDIILMDIQMPEMSGIETTRLIRKLLPGALVIGLTAVDEDMSINQMIQAGAKGYVIKSSVAGELVNLIRTLHQQFHIPKVQPHHLARHRRIHPGRQASPMRTVDRKDTLTRREQEVMQILVKGFSNKEIANRLTISERTVQTHLSNIFNKLDVSSRTEAVLEALNGKWFS
ncbi:MAG: response regulator transcription factor [Caldilineaceae bacterium]